MLLQRDSTYVNHGKSVNIGHESERTPQTRPSNKNVQTLTDLYTPSHRQHLKNIPKLQVTDNMEYGYRPPNKRVQMEGGSLQGWRDFKHGFSKGFGAVAKVALPLIL